MAKPTPRDFKHYVPWLQDFTVKCNCGAQALIVFDPATRSFNPAPGFVAAGWCFDSTPVECWPFGRGWNCGAAYDPSTKAGRHWQRRTSGLDQLDVAKLYRKLCVQLAEGELQC